MLYDSQTAFTFSDLIEFFDGERLIHFADSANNRILLGIRARFGKVRVQVDMPIDSDVLAFRFHLPLHVPEHRRLAMANAIARANFNLLVGAFVMDIEDGELAFHIGLPVSQGCLSRAQLRHCLGAALGSMRELLPKFERVVIHDESPEDLLSNEVLAGESSEPPDRP